MKTATVTITGMSPYSPSRKHDNPKLNREGHDDYEKRTWREKAHYDPKTGRCFIPAMAFKMSVDSAAKFMSIQITGKGKQTYTKHFLSGCIVTKDVPLLGTNIKTVEGQWFSMSSKGQRGVGSRVSRCYPMFHNWSGTVEFAVLDDTITRDVFERVVTEAGKFIGVGRFRPEVGGLNGRWRVDEVAWI